MVHNLTFNAAAAHPQAASIGFQRRFAGELVTCKVAERATWKQVHHSENHFK